jgi:deoxyribodipyrimidine photolyase-related protein
MRNLVIILGDQLNLDSAVWDAFDAQQDVVWMAEVAAESEHVWSHQARIALFLSAMRHFRDRLRKRRITVDYRELDDSENQGDFARELTAAVRRLRPQNLVLVQPGEYRVQELFTETARKLRVPLEVRPDRHFFCTPEEFAEHARGRKQLRLEFFYREMRKRYAILMEGDRPSGGEWNYDESNRGSFSKAGPGRIPSPQSFKPDPVTRQVLELVQRRFAKHPGQLAHFDWPVTTEQAEQALEDFIEHRLVHFGEYQDAMWTDQPFLYHSRLAAAMNLKLLDPRRVVEATEQAYRTGRVPLNAAEGFIRQILGWREYVRGIYWLYMPNYLQRNELQATQPLPDFYWTGQTKMRCLQQTIQQTLEYGYAHHIQRLMITGLYALLLGVRPEAVHEWYLAIYVDAVEWVELPNTLGMSQFADGGIMASKPYAATGKYIDRMSNYCRDCPFDPALATGPKACPFTTLYWDFLMRHEKLLAKNQRMSLQVKNLAKKSASELAAIRSQAEQIRQAD